MSPGSDRELLPPCAALRLGATVRATLLALVLPAAPRERVAALLGVLQDPARAGDGPVGSIQQVHVLRNVARSRHRFAVRRSELAGLHACASLRVLALFHTHHGPPVPSAFDLVQMRRDRLVHVIGGVTEAGVELCAWCDAGTGCRAVVLA